MTETSYYYSYNWRDLLGVQTNWNNLYDINNNKIGILITDRFINTVQPPPDGFTFTPYNVNKTIILDKGLLYFTGVIIEKFPVIGFILETFGTLKNTILVTREVVSIVDDIVSIKITIITSN